MEVEEDWYRTAVVEEAKVRLYLLSAAHEDGQSKARFFMALGFSPPAWMLFRDGVLRHAETATRMRVLQTEWGTRVVAEGPIRGPTGREAEVRSIWQRWGSDSRFRLITVYPAR
jgi:hypothetical protein